MSKQARVLRTVRVEQQLWDDAKQLADELDDETISDVLRSLLTQYVRRQTARKQKRDAR